jgi:hypothetical protein
MGKCKAPEVAAFPFGNPGTLEPRNPGIPSNDGTARNPEPRTGTPEPANDSDHFTLKACLSAVAQSAKAEDVGREAWAHVQLSVTSV